MLADCFHYRTVIAGVVGASLGLGGFAHAEPMHGISMYGVPALAQDFDHLPYARADAPKGGRMVTGETGSFDSLNPHILKGSTPWQLRFLAYESLMGRSWDEPFTLYGLLAETIETGPDREWVEFTLRPEARFSDGSPVTVADVMWSYETLGTQGHPRYRGAWQKIQSMEQTGPRSVRFTFNTDDRELALIAGMSPILKKAQWEGLDFADSGLDVIPISTAPYVIDSFEPGRHVTLKRDPGYWGKDLPFMKGQANLDEIRMEFFGDGAVQFEAFKAGTLNVMRETNAEKWQRQYDFPAVQRGDVVKSEIPHGRPTGMTGFVMNTRDGVFADWRVRDAMLHAFNFEYINETMTGSIQPRIESYFSNSDLGMQPGPATGRVRDLLAPFADTLLPGALDGYALPEGDGSARNRANLRTAMRLMQDAGYAVQNGMMMTPQGAPMRFEIVLSQGSGEEQSIIDIFGQALQRMGIIPTITVIDSAQYNERINQFDFDMTFFRRGLSLSPGNEQRLYWGSQAADTPGSRNLMGMQSPAADAMIDVLLDASSQEDFIAAARALDRVLTSGRYVIPIYQWNIARIAHARQLHYPNRIPVYGDWFDWMPNAWWWEED
ncbi:ABC transporter substrate-binding protein [Salipiger aestuarii]|uniref:Peptide/nickel transport system substrate-binding protein n=1 Tax=Salipiger aestuarii TaxID=568098 RepID=A0A327XQZ1_9RHOB|nr:extracellular solute-binding protein [Salipiger aestuarii]EIE52565.1 putative extracellular solute-binding protein [Citreicella sp. 357]KAA8605588.1 ABC transporter substrate-binding protein [Salipiger aestuarii]KAA8608168.1 ABC transporter substrate-binding protein [Salipiger aestuarii]KAB2539373.1 ABC transporter substrate-binding protein [Salipiger aestuarii]RAK10467.1 peptide/nickel transport system substrate-binding protein [Salipiger aestuarii]